MEVSFVIPCFHPTPVLRELVSDLTGMARAEFDKFEILLVRDSTDAETARTLDQIQKEFDETRQLELSRNYGQQAATVAGIDESCGDIIVTLDDDYQHQPRDAILMIRTLINDSEIQLVYGRPSSATQSKWRARNGKRFRKFLKFAGLDFADSLSPFRAFRGYLRQVFRSSPGPSISVDVILSWVVENVRTVECEFRSREEGESGYTTWSLFRLAMSVLLNYSTKPLRLGIYLGLTGVLLSFIFGIFVGVQYLFGGITVAGFATITLLVLFLGSLQLVVLGIIGIYIGEQHHRGMQRPTYLVATYGKHRTPERELG